MHRLIWLSILVLLCFGGACHKQPASATQYVTLRIEITLNPQAYQDTAWGDPPQFAIWIADQNNNMQTICVTHRTGQGDWEGKPNCPVSLPIWTQVYQLEFQTASPPTWQHPTPDAITCATPKLSLTRTLHVPAHSSWEYNLEINASGDFSHHFPQFSDEGINDDYGNGEPSLVYHGTLIATPGQKSHPTLLGRTDQYNSTKALTQDLSNILLAKDLLANLQVSCTH